MFRARIELYIDPQGEWRWRRKAANYFIVGASTQGYVARSSAIRNLNSELGGSFVAEVMVFGGEFERGKRRVGYFRRDNGARIPVVEIAPTNS